MSLIKTSKEVILDASREIAKYQSGELRPIKTRHSHFNQNTMGGIFPGMIIVIAGIAQMGKTFFLDEIEADFFDDKLNPKNDGHILLRCNWEMTVKNLLTNRLKSELKISKKDILFNKPTSPKFREIVEKEMNPNIHYLPDPTSPDIWYKEVQEFAAKFRGKDHILVTLDHLALVEAGILKKGIDTLLGYANKLKKEFSNISFIFISQLNRDIEYRTDIRFLAPVRSDLYASDAIYHIADIILVKHIPYLLGWEKYMHIQTVDYKHLKKFMNNPHSTHSNFRTKNHIFYHYLKIRDFEDYMQRLHIEKFNEKIEIIPEIPRIESQSVFD